MTGGTAVHRGGIKLGPAARDAHNRLVDSLAKLESANMASATDPAFVKAWRGVLERVDDFQREVLVCEGRQPSCKSGCCACCWHWVEDVNSFESQMIAAHIRERLPHLVPAIVDSVAADCAVMEDLDAEVLLAMQRSRQERTESGEGFDHTDLLLASYYQLRRPCPLLADGVCSVYDIRPLTCRIYVSFSAPERCDPSYINEHDIPTVLLDLEESANALIDRLHERYDTLDNDTSLRTAVAALLYPGQTPGKD